MRRHTLIGERIAQGAPALVGVAGADPLQPRALGRRAATPTGSRGEEIPLGAQIVFVCDSFSAMTTDRCYQAGDDARPRRSRSCAATPAPSSPRRSSRRSRRAGPAPGARGLAESLRAPRELGQRWRAGGRGALGLRHG